MNITSNNGTPADSFGSNGDFVIDYGGRFLWGPKGNVTSGSWVGTAVSTVGPTGAMGPSPLLPQMVNQGVVWGQSVQYPNINVIGSSGAPGTPAYATGMAVSNVFTPQQNTSLMGVSASNYSATGATVYFFLYDIAAQAIVYNFNGGNGLANNTTTSLSFTASQYPLTAGKQYQWQAIRSSAGATTLQITPQYLLPSGAPSSLSYFTPAIINTATTVAKSSSITLLVPGMNNQSIVYKNAASSYIYFIEAWLAGSGVSDIYLYNQNTSANQFTQDPYGYTTLTSTPTRYTFGPFSPTTWPLTANNQYSMNIYAPSGSLTINSAVVTLTVGQ